LLTAIAFVIFLLLAAFFSAAETAYTSISALRLKSLLEKKAEGSKELEHLIKDRRELITATLIGNNIVNTAGSALATAVTIGLMAKIGIHDLTLTMFIVTTVMTVLILTFGEITPKTLAFKHAEKLSLVFSRPMGFFMFLFRPIIWIFSFFSRGISRLFGWDYQSVTRILSDEEIKAFLNVAIEEGLLEKEEKDMIHSIFEFGNTMAREIMTPRPDTVCIPGTMTVGDAIQIIQEKGHSRLPVYEDRIDNIVGVLHAKDLLWAERKNGQNIVRKFVREAVFIPETKNVEDLLLQMKRAKFHMAIVLDEYGGLSGVITLEDIIEEIVGDIQDEFDRDEDREIIKLGQDHYLADAKIHIDDLSEIVGIGFPNDEVYDTLGGFILSYLGKFPSKGEEMVFENLIFKIKDVHKRRLQKIEIRKLPAPAKSSED
jgi:putative hemolysin